MLDMTQKRVGHRRKIEVGGGGREIRRGEIVSSHINSM